MKNLTIQYPTFNVGDMDLSFVHDMCEGGISGGDCRDVYFDDTTDYSKIIVTDKEIEEYLQRLSK